MRTVVFVKQGLPWSSNIPRRFLWRSYCQLLMDAQGKAGWVWASAMRPPETGRERRREDEIQPEITLLSVRMVISPSPAVFRVGSIPEQFPMLVVYESGIRLLGDTLPFTEVPCLELAEDCAIRFMARGCSKQYAT